ncbi:hypothetical protein [Veillonella sp.]|uniref:hypothetical protein n=1 Tax=Veillonella sp. TaxID=1926307 RepID=UPI00257E6C58|nr:hypothetical protein [Veillonella sp.]MBS6486253.1 hypothetical protein [Veillonella sp.]
MNAKEKKSLEILFSFVKGNYKEVLKEEDFDVSYKNIDAKFLSKARRKTTAFLKYIGEREFRGCVYGKNNVRLIKNSDMVKLNKRVKNRIILTPDLILYKTYSPEYVKILKFFVENILWEKLNEHNIEYLTEYVIPTLTSRKDVFAHPAIPKIFVSTKQRSYHYFPDVWARPDNDNLNEPLVGLELEVYARNKYIFENKSNFFYLQRDGSLSEENGGTEITTIPMPFEELIREDGGIDILTKDFMPRFSCYSQKATETGFHIHLSKINFNRKVCVLLKKAFYCFPYAFITELFGRNNTGYCRAEPQIQKLMEFGIHPNAASDLGLEKIFQPYCDTRYLELNFTNSKTIEFRRGKGTVDSVSIKSILDFCYQIYKYSMEAQNLYKSDLLNIRLFLQTYLMENAKTERLKKLIKKYEEYKK